MIEKAQSFITKNYFELGLIVASSALYHAFMYSYKNLQKEKEKSHHELLNIDRRFKSKSKYDII